MIQYFSQKMDILLMAIKMNIATKIKKESYMINQVLKKPLLNSADFYIATIQKRRA